MRRSGIPMTFAIMAALALAGCDGGDKDHGSSKGAGGPPGGMPPTQVGIVTLQPKTIEVTEDLPGRTSAFQVAEIRPQVNGIILKRLFEEGGTVKAGQQLYQIDPAVYQANYQTAIASLHKAQALDVSARDQAVRYKQLVKVNAISKQAYDDALATEQSDEADIASAQAAVESAQVALAYTKVMSPITGRIGKSTVTAGALVTANQTDALTTVTQLDPIYVDVTQSSAQLLQLKQKIAAGQLKAGSQDAAVSLNIDEINQKYPQQGVLKFSDVTVDPTTGSVDLRAEFPNPDGTLLPGLFVRASINEGQRDNVILVPQQAVTRDAEGNASVLLVDSDNKVQQAAIDTGEAIGDQWIANSGVKGGERVIVQGIQKVKPGATVQVVELPGSGAMAPPPSGDAAGAQ
jgi:membrane fusion protein (multidrug efflux system)